jgi:hypothetical protein
MTIETQLFTFYLQLYIIWNHERKSGIDSLELWAPKVELNNA